MKPNYYKIFREAIEIGVGFGYRRAYKHTDEPSEEILKDEIIEAIMIEIHEWVDFDDLE
jgi:hypothetical protein